jgi:hypothetical protein
MALKIDKPGSLPVHHATFKGKCKLCGCEVSTTDKADLKSGESGLDAQHGFYVNCPTQGCGRQIDMQEVVYRGGA